MLILASNDVINVAHDTANPKSLAGGYLKFFK